MSCVSALIGDLRRGAHDVDLDAVHLGEGGAQLLRPFGRVVRHVPGELAFLLGGFLKRLHVGARRDRAEHERSSDGEAAHFFMCSSRNASCYRWRAIASHEAQCHKRSTGWAAYYDKLRDRPPRRTLLAALDAFGERQPMRLRSISAAVTAATSSRFCDAAGSVVAVDAEPRGAAPARGARRCPGTTSRRSSRASRRCRCRSASQLVNSSFAMPLCEPRAISRPVGADSRGPAAPAADSAANGMARATAGSADPGITFLARDEALALLDGLDVEMFEEEEADGITPRGKPKHWQSSTSLRGSREAASGQGRPLSDTPEPVPHSMAARSVTAEIAKTRRSSRLARSARRSGRAHQAVPARLVRRHRLRRAGGTD